MFELMRTWKAGKIDVLFFKEDGVVTMGMLPAGMAESIPPHRENNDDSRAALDICKVLNISFKSTHPDSMLQLRLAGDDFFADHSAGISMRNSGAVNDFKLVSQEDNGEEFVSNFDNGKGLAARQFLRAHGDYIECRTELKNYGNRTVRVEMLEAFAVGMISMLHRDGAPGELVFHQFKTNWSDEARHVSTVLEDLGLEESWQCEGTRAYRYGERSSMVNRGQHPFGAIEDTANGVTWAASIDAITPWQMLVWRNSDFVTLCGGLPDREFNGWFKDLRPGETLVSPVGLLSVVKGRWQDAARALVKYQRTEAPQEQARPTFSDWCTIWGKSTDASLMAIAPRLQELGCPVLQVDAGWFKKETPGMWDLNEERYPRGFGGFADALLKDYGLTAGVWFEFETVVNPDLATFPMKDLLATIDGSLINVGGRYFWNMTRHAVIQHLVEKVALFLRENHVGYLKVDYNAQIPFGMDGESLSAAENLRQMLQISSQFHANLHKLVPGLLIEECASGGHRFTPGWARIGDFVSVSDAHEGVEIPIIAAGALHLCDYDKALVWTTLRAEDDENREAYTLCAGLLGKMQLSGNIDRLSDWQFANLKRAVEFYGKISADLRHNGHLDVRCDAVSRTKPKGAQCVTLNTEREMLVVVHFFDQQGSPNYQLPDGAWEQVDAFGGSEIKWSLNGNALAFEQTAPFSACAMLLRRK